MNPEVQRYRLPLADLALGLSALSPRLQLTGKKGSNRGRKSGLQMGKAGWLSGFLE